MLVTDHLGNIISPGQIVYYASGSPTATGSYMCYAWVDQIKMSKTTGKPIISVYNIPTVVQWQNSKRLAKETGSNYWFKNWAKRQGLSNAKVLTVLLDPNDLPLELQSVKDEMTELIGMGVPAFTEYIKNQ